MKKVVIDTSVLFASLVSKNGSSFKLLKIIKEKNIHIVIDIRMYVEYIRVLVNKASKYIGLHEVILFLAGLKKYFIFTSPKLHFSLCRDPKDNKFLDVAYEAKAKYIITLDKDLLDLRDENKEVNLNGFKVRILTPKEFIEEIEK